MKQKTSTGKRMFVLLATAFMLVASLAGCATPAATQAPSAAASTAPAATQPPKADLPDGGVTNPTGYEPIVNQPVSMTAAIIYGAHMGDMAKYEIWKNIEKKTGIKLELNILADAEKVNLMFASRDYPDLAFRLDPQNTMVMDAAEAGDLVQLDPLLEQYAPLWADFFKNNPMMAKYVQMRDGKMYSLPYVEWLEWNVNLRDQWFINGNWLTELSLPEPKTTAEFKDYLVKVKENAGKGTIPANVIPFYILYDSWIGGQFDVYASFGVFMCQGPYLYLDNGKIKSQVENPNLKEAIKYLADLYQSGLMAPEIFTDDWGAYVSKITSEPAIAGSLGTHNNNGKAWWKAIGPLDSGEGRPSYMRSQSKGVRLNAFMIFKDNKYPVASLRLANMLSDPDGLLFEEFLGFEGIHYNKAGDKYEKIATVDTAKQGENLKPLGNYCIALVDDNIISKYLSFPATTKKDTREYDYLNRYKSHVPTEMQIPSIPSTYYTSQENELITQYATDCSAYLKKVIATWITGEADIEAGWSQLLPKLNEMGYQEYIALVQKGYDKLME